ncbi:MAG: hypothetical protein LBI60_03465 [Bacteroidales bacterium]|jgi:hypothetical protein|nr:hypothetical protein [Bacteroidales bacterium]
MKVIYTIFNKTRGTQGSILFFLAILTTVPFSLSVQKSVNQSQTREFILYEHIREVIIAYAKLASTEVDKTMVLMLFSTDKTDK